MKCKLHPKYRAQRPPRSLKKDCTCQEVWDAGLKTEMERRTSIDGIPRFITADGRIMKMDWELPADVDVDPEALEDHIKRLLEQHG